MGGYKNSTTLIESLCLFTVGGHQCLSDEAEEQERDSIDRLQNKTRSCKLPTSIHNGYDINALVLCNIMYRLLYSTLLPSLYRLGIDTASHIHYAATTVPKVNLTFTNWLICFCYHHGYSKCVSYLLLIKVCSSIYFILFLAFLSLAPGKKKDPPLVQ